VRNTFINPTSFIGEGEDERQRARQRMVAYITMAGLRKTISRGGTGALPPTMAYFKKIGARLNDAKASDFDDNSLLYGSPQPIIDTLKRVEAIGVDEVILYFNFGNRPDAVVREQMHRFSDDIAPAFAGAPGETAAAPIVPKRKNALRARAPADPKSA
jgi:alkanesulfonate monooxygenase SsuD/methylene tetrahydromethanopterin reductase-like flavin-dependent oxidoreductase (luciferase family)